MICRITDWQRCRELRATREVREMREIKPRVLAANSVRQQSLVGEQFRLRQSPQVLWNVAVGPALLGGTNFAALNDVSFPMLGLIRSVSKRSITNWRL